MASIQDGSQADGSSVEQAMSQPRWACVLFWASLAAVAAILVWATGRLEILTSIPPLRSETTAIALSIFTLTLVLPARFFRRFVQWALPISLVLCTAFNLGAFKHIDAKIFSPLRLRPKGDYLTLLDKHPAWRELGQYYMYNVIRRHAEGKCITIYDRSVIPEYYVRLVANVGEYRAEKYPHKLTPWQAEALLQRPCCKLEHPLMDCEYYLIKPYGNNEAKSDFRVFDLGKRLFLVPVDMPLPTSAPAS